MTKILLRKPLAHPDGHLRKAAAPNKPKPPSQAEIQARRLANKLIDEEQQARRIAQAAKVQPLVASYFSGKSMLTETVFLDGVECFRPLAIGIHKTVLAWLRSQPETVGCSKTLLKDLVEAVLEPHVSKPQYRAGLSRFRERFDLDGNIAGIVVNRKANCEYRKLCANSGRFQLDQRHLLFVTPHLSTGFQHG